MQNIYKQTRRSIINRQAEILFRKLKLEPGFDPCDAVRRLGGTLKEVSQEELGEDVVAKIRPTDDNGSFQISYVREGIEDTNFRFSIAHELGHLFLHMAKKDEATGRVRIEGVFNRYKQSSSIMEWEAEEFAAAFLMPQDYLRMKVEELEVNNKIEDKINELSEEFGVSYKSIITRGKSLDIW